MEPTKLQSEEFKDVSNISTGTSLAETRGMHRDSESIDDFEHLEPELSPVKEFQEEGFEVKMDKHSVMDSKGVPELVSRVASSISQDVGSFNEPKSTSQFGDGNFLSSSITAESDALLQGSKVLAKLAEEVKDLSSHAIHPEVDETSSASEFDSKLEPEFDVDNIIRQKALSQALMDFEREHTKSDSSVKHGDTSEKFTPEVDLLKSETITTSVPGLDSDTLSTVTIPTDISSSTHDTSNNHSNVQDSDVPELLDLLIPDSKLKGNLSDESGYSKSFLSAQEDDYQDTGNKQEKEPESKPLPSVSESHIKSSEPVKPAELTISVKPETIAAVEPITKAFPDRPSIIPSDSTVMSKPAASDSDLGEIKPIQLFHSMGLGT